MYLFAVLLAAVLSAVARGDVSVVVPASTTASLKGRLELRLAAEPPGGPGDAVALSSCAVRPPGALVFVRLAEKAAPTAGMRLLGDYAKGLCGVAVQPVGKEHQGTWTLRAVFKESSTTATARANVTVNEFSDAVVPDKPSVLEGAVFTLRMALIRVGVNFSSCAVVPPEQDSPITLAHRGGGSSGEGRLQFWPGVGAAGASVDALLESGWCAVKVSAAGSKDKGRWILEGTEAGTGAVRRAGASVTVYGTVMRVLPSSTVLTEEGEKVVLRLAFDDAEPRPSESWAGCQVVTPDGGVVQLAGSGPRTPTASDVDVEDTVRYAGVSVATDCAVELGPLEQRHGGSWKLVAGAANADERVASAKVLVNGPYKPSGGSTVTVELGTRGQPLFCGPQDKEAVLSCELRDPTGLVAASFPGRCQHTVDRVRAKHNGTWACSVLLRGYADAVKDTVQLALAEPVHVDTGVQLPGRASGRSSGRAATQSSVVLECRLAGTRACRDSTTSVRSCIMESPHGDRILLKDGVVLLKAGQGRYVYAGRGFGACDCSMAIATPLRTEDLGVWKCIVGLSSGRTRGGLITLSGDAAGRATRESGVRDAGAVAFRDPVDGVVAPGSKVRLGCRAQHALAYCWLWPPRGEDKLAVTEDGPAHDGIRYAGMGLELGECGVEIDSVNANHSGTWRCGLGLADRGVSASLDLEVPVEIVVSDSLVVPLEANVSGAVGHSVTLGCRTLLEDALEYCRFQRPDGSSLHLADVGAQSAGGNEHLPYRFVETDAGRGGSLARGLCRLAIATVTDDDFGPWTCAVRVAGDSPGQEQTASVVLLRTGDTAEAMVIGLAVGAVLLLVAGAAVVGCRRYRAPLPRRARSSSVASSPSSQAALALSAASDASPSVESTRRTTRSTTARVMSSVLPSTRFPARMRSASSREVPMHLQSMASNRSSASSGSEEGDVFPNRKRQ